MTIFLHFSEGIMQSVHWCRQPCLKHLFTLHSCKALSSGQLYSHTLVQQEFVISLQVYQVHKCDIHSSHSPGVSVCFNGVHKITHSRKNNLNLLENNRLVAREMFAERTGTKINVVFNSTLKLKKAPAAGVRDVTNYLTTG